jgi:hypothetical protein
VLRTVLIAMLALAQGIPSLACGLTLCLHSDGGFCLESPERDCCGHHQGLEATHDDCCGSHDEHPASPYTSSGIGKPSCDCTHVALLSQPQFTHKVGRDQGNATLHHLGMPSVLFTAPASAVSLGVPLSREAETAGGGNSGALSFLAPVMLRC